jgi:hypothetical protein
MMEASSLAFEVRLADEIPIQGFANLNVNQGI